MEEAEEEDREPLRKRTTGLNGVDLNGRSNRVSKGVQDEAITDDEDEKLIKIAKI